MSKDIVINATLGLSKKDLQSEMFPNVPHFLQKNTLD